MDKNQNNNINLSKSDDIKDNSFFSTKDVAVHLNIRLKDRVKILLMRLGMSQNKLAKEIGINKSTLSRVVNGDWTPTSFIKLRMAQVLQVDSLVLFGDSKFWAEWNDKIGYGGKDGKK